MSMYRCPKCKGVELEVVVTCWAALLQDGPDEFETDTDSPDDGSHEWDEESNMVCKSADCTFHGKAKKFESPDWARCNGSDSNGVECDEILEQGQDYFGSPCGTYCSEHMEEHARRCEICAKEFGLTFGEEKPTDTDQSLYNIPEGCICMGDGLFGVKCWAPQHATLKSTEEKSHATH